MTDNSSIILYVNKPEKRITCKNKTGYYLTFLSLKLWDTWELLACLLGNKNNISKDKNGKNISHVEITESVLVHCNIVNSDCPHDLEPCTHLS